MTKSTATKSVAKMQLLLLQKCCSFLRSIMQPFFDPKMQPFFEPKMQPFFDPKMQPFFDPKNARVFLVAKIQFVALKIK
jgi:hypothetical protein